MWFGNPRSKATPSLLLMIFFLGFVAFSSIQFNMFVRRRKHPPRRWLVFTTQTTVGPDVKVTKLKADRRQSPEAMSRATRRAVKQFCKKNITDLAKMNRY